MRPLPHLSVTTRSMEPQMPKGSKTRASHARAVRSNGWPGEVDHERPWSGAALPAIEPRLRRVLFSPHGPDHGSPWVTS